MLYRDSSGVPGTKVAESNVVNITSGSVGRWVNFSAPSAALAPGSYWLVIHTGGTTGVARNAGDGSTVANWYANNDTFSDGASDPFGGGNAGTGTISRLRFLHTGDSSAVWEHDSRHRGVVRTQRGLQASFEIHAVRDGHARQLVRLP